MPRGIRKSVASGRAATAMSHVLSELRKAEHELVRELDGIRAVIRSIGGGGGARVAQAKAGRRKRQLSSKGREAIARAARARWAKWRAAKKKGRKA